MVLPEIRILDIKDDTWHDKLLVTITYYGQYDSPHICDMSAFVSPKQRAKLRAGMVFNTYKEFEDFLNDTNNEA